MPVCQVWFSNCQISFINSIGNQMSKSVKDIGNRDTRHIEISTDSLVEWTGADTVSFAIPLLLCVCTCTQCMRVALLDYALAYVIVSIACTRTNAGQCALSCCRTFQIDCGTRMDYAFFVLSMELLNIWKQLSVHAEVEPAESVKGLHAT
jgi:hypothetical protein